MKKKKFNYDVSIQNENSLFYSLFEKRKHYYVLEDKSLGNKIYSESTIIRYNILNTNIDKKKFFAKIRLSKNCLYFCSDFICDKVVVVASSHNLLMKGGGFYEVRSSFMQ